MSDQGNQKTMQLHYPSNSCHWHRVRPCGKYIATRRLNKQQQMGFMHDKGNQEWQDLTTELELLVLSTLLQ